MYTLPLSSEAAQYCPGWGDTGERLSGLVWLVCLVSLPSLAIPLDDNSHCVERSSSPPFFASAVLSCLGAGTSSHGHVITVVRSSNPVCGSGSGARGSR